MANFLPTLVDNMPKYEAGQKFERWTASGTVSDTTGTVTARFLDRVDRAEVESFGGSITSKSVSSNKLIVTLPGGTSSPITYDIKLIMDGQL